MDRRRQYYGCLVMFTAHIGIFGLGPIIPLYAKRTLGATPALVFLTSFSRDVVQILLRIPLGALSDKVGRKPLMTLGLICYAIAQTISFVAPSPEVLLLAMAVTGVGLSAFIPPSQAWFAELAEEGRIGEAIGMRDMAMTLTMMVGPPVCGSLALIFPTYRPIFLATLGFTFLGLVTLSLSAETHPPTSRTSWIGNLKELRNGIVRIPSMLSKMFKDRGMLASSITTFFSGFVSGPFESYYTLYSSTRLGLDEVMISTGFTARGLTSTLSITYWGRLSDRIGRFQPMAMGLAVLASVLMVIPSVREY
ncbi:MAG: MFS transporter, partial [Candidatus Bathyarchaeia archaeon]